MPGQAIDPDVWDDTIVRLIEQISELPTCWRDEPRPMTDPITAAMVLLHVPSSVHLGVDETRIEVDETKLSSDPPEEMKPTQCGLRRTVLQCQVDAYDQDAKRRSRHFLERIRTRIRRPSSLATLGNLETSLITITPVVVLEYIRDNRAYSRATMDILLQHTVIEPDQPFGRIASFGGAGEFQDAAGDVVRTLDYTIQLEP